MRVAAAAAVGGVHMLVVVGIPMVIGTPVAMRAALAVG